MIIVPTYTQSCTVQQPAGIYVQPGSCPSTQPLVINGQTYTLAFDDEFTRDTTLVSPWSYTNPTFAYPQRNGTGDAAYDVDPLTDPTALAGPFNPFSFSSAGLAITARPIPSALLSAPQFSNVGTPKPTWLSGALTGPPMQYGYMEFEATVPSVQGFWPALWFEENNNPGINTTTDPYPQFVEADAMELFGSAEPPGTIFQTLHYTYAAATPNNPAALATSQVISQATPHTYGVLWTSTSVQFYVDRLPTSPVYPTISVGPMLPIIQLQVFPTGSWAPAPANQSPQSMTVQYFRWYQVTTATT